MPLLNERQLEALHAAQAQQHIALQERVYSTGKAVERAD